ncbi:MAG: pyridoxal-phosphate dependent enzyme [Woeseiaceae bacterium]|nr:pyridoxal-phosphate dependent enzyme [Woeseiaceae bacterium]
MGNDVERVAAAAVAALPRIAGMIRETPLTCFESLGSKVGGEVWCKRENLQRTGSFKLRGAVNRLLTLPPDERARGCVAASSGNHGAAVACALGQLGVPGVIFVPERTSAAKVEKIRRYGGDVRFHGVDGLDTEQHARSFAADHGMCYVSPYNDPEVVAGQGTCGVEIAAAGTAFDAAFIAVGGGGLVSGVGSVLRAAWPGIRLYGCQPAASAVMAESVAAGRILDLPSGPTLSDGTAGGIETGSITFPLVRRLVDEFLLVDEPAIAAAMQRYRAEFGEPVEGAAGVALAALAGNPELGRGQRSLVIVCGGNVSDETLAAIDAGGRPG